jgi:asparagine synthase (glutamine-hydrolysing)
MMSIVPVKNNSDSHVVMRDQYGWEVFHKGNIKLWFCGYMYGISIENLLDQVHKIVGSNLESDIILNWIKNINGHFAFVIEFNSLVIFADNNGDILISNHAPFLKKKCNLGSDDLDDSAVLEVSMSGYTIGNKTFYKDIKRLESGECLLLRENLHNVERYYTYSPWKVIDRSENELQSEFLHICLKIFKRIKDHVGDRQIVIPLSAGNDSRLIISGLKEVGVKNVVCVSYGRRGNFETPISKDIAGKLGYDLVYIADKLKDKRRFFQSEVYQKYIEAFESFSYTHSIQEVYEVFLLKQTKAVDNDAVIINGSCGDFISGGHIRPTLDIDHTPNNVDEISWDKFLDKHFSLWEDLRVLDNDSYIKSELKKTLLSRITDPIDFNKYQYAAMECSEFIGRQSKIVMGQQRTYEYYGYEWMLPLWSDEMLFFWESVPYQYKLDQYLYTKALYESNWGNVWHNIKVNDKMIRPFFLRWFRTVLKIIFIPIGKSKWHRFEKNVLEYFMHPSYALTVTSYFSVLFDRRGHRGAYSWISYQMIELVKRKKC